MKPRGQWRTYRTGTFLVPSSIHFPTMPEASNIYSRWLSEERATPPVKIPTTNPRTPAGVPETLSPFIPIGIENHPSSLKARHQLHTIRFWAEAQNVLAPVTPVGARGFWHPCRGAGARGKPPNRWCRSSLAQPPAINLGSLRDLSALEGAKIIYFTWLFDPSDQSAPCDGARLKRA
jgi:hypothetical protein